MVVLFVVLTLLSAQLSLITEGMSRKHVVTSATSLQTEIHRLTLIISVLAVTAAVGEVLYWELYLRLNSSSHVTTPLLIYRLISVLVALIPLGFPGVLNVGLALVARRLRFQHGLLVKQLDTVEALGSVTVMAVDKTGTLTEGRMTVTGIRSAASIPLTDNSLDSRAAADLQSIRDKSYLIAALCNQAALTVTTTPANGADGAAGADVESAPVPVEVITGSNALDRALLQWSHAQIPLPQQAAQYDVRASFPFTPQREMAASVITDNQSGVTRVLVKGALERLLPFCTSYLNVVGRCKPMSEEFTHQMTELVRQEARQGRRIIALAESAPLCNELFPPDFVYQTEPWPNFPWDELMFIACLQLSDPPRPQVSRAVRLLRAAGISVPMVTGDWEPTAIAVAHATGIVTCDPDEIGSLRGMSDDAIHAAVDSGALFRALSVSGSDLENLTPLAWDYVFQHAELVFSRTTPRQKFQIVSEAQQRGHRVGVTGDGANDCPALQISHVGITMRSGTDAARSAGNMVLLRDDFAQVVCGVREGRACFDNIRHVVCFLLAGGCWPQMLAVLAAVFLGMPSPIGLFLKIVISCLTNVFCGVALMMEAPHDSSMRRQPRDIGTFHLIDLGVVCYSFFFYGTLIAFGAFYNYFDYMATRGGDHGLPASYSPSDLLYNWQRWGKWKSYPLDAQGNDEYAAAKEGSAVFFVTVVVAQMGHLVSIRRSTPYFYRTRCRVPDLRILYDLCGELWSSRVFWPVAAAWAASLATALLFTEVPSLQRYCETAAVPGKYWAMAVGWAALWFALGELRKWIVTLYPHSCAACWQR